MEDYENKLKENGLALRKIPSSQRTPKLCTIAVRQNPKAIRYVPAKLQTMDLCKEAIRLNPSVINLVSDKASKRLDPYTVKRNWETIALIPEYRRTDQLCRLAVKGSVKAFAFLSRDKIERLFESASEDMVTDCMEWIHENISASVFLPSCIQKNIIIMKYQMQEGFLTICEVYYEKIKQRFCVSAQFALPEEELGRVNAKPDYEVTGEIDTFNELYQFLNGNLSGAELGEYDFEGIDLHQYNISGAVVHHNVLLRNGMYDPAFYNAHLQSVSVPDTLPARNELSVADDTNELGSVLGAADPHLGTDEMPIFYISDIHLEYRLRYAFPDHATQEEVFSHIRMLVKQMTVSAINYQNDGYLCVVGDTGSDPVLVKYFFRELAKRWPVKKVIVVLGNHELWDVPGDLSSRIEIWRSFFDELGIWLLQNELLCIPEPGLASLVPGASEVPFALNESQISKLTPAKIKKKSLCCSLCILGGIGFSGLNSEFNAEDGIYMGLHPEHSVTRAEEIEESKRFAKLYGMIR